MPQMGAPRAPNYPLLPNYSPLRPRVPQVRSTIFALPRARVEFGSGGAAPPLMPTELLACAERLAPTRLARPRLLKDSSLGTLVPPGRDGKFLTISLDKKPRPPVRRLPKDVELVEQAAPPPPKLEPACVNCGRVATLRCSA